MDERGRGGGKKRKKEKSPFVSLGESRAGALHWTGLGEKKENWEERRGGRETLKTRKKGTPTPKTHSKKKGNKKN